MKITDKKIIEALKAGKEIIAKSGIMVKLD